MTAATAAATRGRGIPGVDLIFLSRLTRRLAERRLHAYRPGARRSAVALLLRFDEATQSTLTGALQESMARHRGQGAGGLTRRSRLELFSFPSREPPSLSGLSDTMPEGGLGEEVESPLELFHFLEHREGCVDVDAPSSLRLLFLKRADVDASRWSGQVAFPGGQRDPDDRGDFETVCRCAYEMFGLPLQHRREFICLGRLPDYKLHSRTVDTRGLVQARFVFLHGGATHLSVQSSSYEVERARWVPLRELNAAHLQRGRIVHPLRAFVQPQDADRRLLLGELFGDTYLAFPSVRLPSTAKVAVPSADMRDGDYVAGEGGEGGPAAEAGAPRGNRATFSSSSSSSSSSYGSPPWHIWGLPLRSTNELLAMGNRPPFDWPVVESNSLLLRYGVLYPFHGFYELLLQLYWWRAWLWASTQKFLARRFKWPGGRSSVGHDEVTGIATPASSLDPPSTAKHDTAAAAAGMLTERHWRRVLHGSPMERRHAALPVYANPLLYVVPEVPTAAHVACTAGVACLIFFLTYSVMVTIHALCTVVKETVRGAGARECTARLREYHSTNTLGSAPTFHYHSSDETEVENADTKDTTDNTDSTSEMSHALRDGETAPRAVSPGEVVEPIPLFETLEGRLLSTAPATEVNLDVALCPFHNVDWCAAKEEVHAREMGKAGQEKATESEAVTTMESTQTLTELPELSHAEELEEVMRRYRTTSGHV